MTYSLAPVTYSLTPLFGRLLLGWAFCPPFAFYISHLTGQEGPNVKVTNRIEEIVEPLLNNLGFELVQLTLLG